MAIFLPLPQLCADASKLYMMCDCIVRAFKWVMFTTYFQCTYRSFEILFLITTTVTALSLWGSSQTALNTFRSVITEQKILFFLKQCFIQYKAMCIHVYSVFCCSVVMLLFNGYVIVEITYDICSVTLQKSFFFCFTLCLLAGDLLPSQNEVCICSLFSSVQLQPNVTESSLPYS